jgi:hypothetical protein
MGGLEAPKSLKLHDYLNIPAAFQIEGLVEHITCIFA